MPTSRHLVRSLLILLVPLVGSLAGCAPEQPPNFLFIVTDDQRHDMLGTVHPFLETPHMDQLAEDGVRFQNAFVTTPICAASRASLLTGMYERTHGFTFGTPPLDSDHLDQSYPALLKRAGYQSAFIGKFGVGIEPGMEDSLFHVFQTFAAHPYFREDEQGVMRHLTDITTDHAIRYLESVDPSTPFALTLSFNAPHADDADAQQFIWPEATDSLYRSEQIPLPALSEPAFFDQLPAFLAAQSLNRIRWYWRFDTPEKAERMTKGYYRMISGVDAGIGRVMDALESRGLADNTIIILMGDNGYFLGERGYAGKWLPLELSIRVPLIIADPRHGSAIRGAIPSEPVLNVDIAPTILDLAGLDIPPSMQGSSLVPILQDGSSTTWREDFFVEHLFDHPDIPKHEGVRGPRFKYARYFEQEPVYEELYDLQTDSLEMTNLASSPEHDDRLRAMRSRTDEWVDRLGGPYRKPDRP